MLIRGLLAAGMVVLGAVILARMFGVVGSGGLGILPGVVLGGAMIGLGAHRLSLIVRARRTP